MSKFQISPNVQIVVGAIVAVLTLGSKGAIQLPAGIPASWGPIVDSWSTFILQIYSVIAPIMLAYTSSQPGPLAPEDSPAVKAAMAKDALATKAASGVVGALVIGLLALGALSLVAPSTARAAGAADAKVGIPVSPTPNLNPNSSPSGGGILSGGSILQQIANYFAADPQAAIDLAYDFPTPPDGNGPMCWVQGGQLTAILKAHPAILTGKPETDMEAWRLATMRARAICDNTACQTIAQEFASGLKTMAPIDLPLPTQNAFSDVCLHVPHLASVALPTPEPMVSPTPTATPTGN